MKKEIRLRYAPSPTGKLHIGGARTALFNYLYAKHTGGKFIIRIEDTDLKRNLVDGEAEQIDNLKWLGVEPDYYPGKSDNHEELALLRQSERTSIYQKYAQKLLEQGHAYKCYCTKEELEIEHQAQKDAGVKSPKYSKKCLLNHIEKPGAPFSIRLKMPANKDIFWNDGIRGKVTVNSDEIEDWVMIKTNGIPTYNFANVIDDYLMKITHVVRGEEHISNTPKQLYLYELLGWEAPTFVHLTVIIGENNKKLSKRDTSVIQFISDYRERGYLPKAIFNFLSLLGWSPKTEEEIFGKEQLINLFTFEGCSKSSSKFDLDKLKWTNNYYLQLLSKEEAFSFLETFLPKEIKTKYSLETQKEIVELYRPQLKEGIELNELASIFVKPKIMLEEERNYFENEAKVKEISQFILENIDSVEWTIEPIKAFIKTLGKALEIKGKHLYQPIRLMLFGEEHGPALSELLLLLGKEEVIKRTNEQS